MGWISFQLMATIVVRIDAQQQRQQPKMQPLGDVLLLVLDSNKDQRVTMDEVRNQLQTLEQLFQHGNDEESREYLQLLRNVERAAPKLFELVDSNQDARLNKAELKHVTQFEKSIQKGGAMKQFVRDCFALMDGDSNDELSYNEWTDASSHLAAMAEKFHAVFPALRSKPEELESFVRDMVLLGNAGDGDGTKATAELERKSKEVFRSIDADGDGAIQRKEVGVLYNATGKRFLEISKTIKQMGPMLAMFGGGDMMGNMNLKTEF